MKIKLKNYNYYSVTPKFNIGDQIKIIDTISNAKIDLIIASIVILEKNKNPLIFKNESDKLLYKGIERDINVLLRFYEAETEHMPNKQIKELTCLDNVCYTFSNSINWHWLAEKDIIANLIK